jgi:large subunit ribosomal protein L25
MQGIKLEAKKRDLTKKEASKRYRREGLVPSVLYGQGNNINILIDSKIFNKLAQSLTKSTIIDLSLEGKNYQVLIKDYEKDYINNRYVHVDFFELREDKPVHFRLSLTLVGIPAGVREGGVLEKHIMELDIECLPKYIVSHLDVNVDHLKVNQSLHVSDIVIDKDKYKVLTHLDEVIVHIAGKMAEEVEVAPEVVAEVVPAEGTVVSEEGAAKDEKKEEPKAEKGEKDKG